MVIAWIGYCLLISGLLALAAFASERALGHFRKPVRWAWFAAIAGSVTVPVVAFFAPGLLPGFEVSSAAPAVGSSDLAIVAVAPELPATAAEAGGGFDAAAVGTVLAWGWLLLIAAMVGYLGRIYGRLRSEMRTWTPGHVAGSPVMISDERGPAVVGIRRSIVVMPRWIPELEDRLLRLVFLHEREHQRAGDHRLFAAAVAALVLMPWNLLVWWQVSRLRLAIEFDCDRRVLRRGESPRDYADALLTVGSRVSGPLLAAAAFAERKPAVERRLRRMTEPAASMRPLRTLGASGVVMVAVLFVLGCPGPETSVNAPEPPAATVTPPSESSEWAPPLGPGEEAMARGDRPSFIAYDRPPVLQNAGEVSDALMEAYTQDLKEAGIGGRVEMWLYLDASGVVRNSELKTPSGHDALDAAAADVVATMRFEPAMNRDEPTDVWVSQWVTFEVLDVDEDGAPDALVRPATDEAPLIIVDGVIQSEGTSLGDLQALDIGHVEIVKGDRAVEMYGERARNGVVEITTKGGAAEDDPTEDARTYLTLSRVKDGELSRTRIATDRGLEIEDIVATGVLDDVDRDGLLEVRVVPRPENMPDPLIVIDGVISDAAGLSHLGELDIDHVEVVKGRAAQEAYGERARHGVIEITTKAGAADGDAPADQPIFAPYDTAPVLQNVGEIQQVLERAYPSDLKQAGIGGRVEMWVYVDPSGAVVNYEVKTSSGNEALDRAAAKVVEQMRFRPASNRDEPTAARISQWVTFHVI
ncbi:TonB family protein [Candidatus Palauibacter sp.]|uniref:TonB family protein n=1 Tax=Candidatus Palauibacter sp. TaxID=3101350 RepID=UPI003B017735